MFCIEIINNKIKHDIVTHLRSLLYEHKLFNRTKIYDSLLLGNSSSKYSNIAWKLISCFVEGKKNSI